MPIKEFMPLEWDKEREKKSKILKPTDIASKEDLDRGKLLIEQLNKKRNG